MIGNFVAAPGQLAHDRGLRRQVSADDKEGRSDAVAFEKFEQARDALLVDQRACSGRRVPADALIVDPQVVDVDLNGANRFVCRHDKEVLLRAFLGKQGHYNWLRCRLQR